MVTTRSTGRDLFTGGRLGAFALLLGLAAGAFSAAAVPLVIYDDQLRNGFVDYSWAVHSLNQTSRIHAGAAAASFEPDAYKGFYLHRDAGLVVTRCS